MSMKLQIVPYEPRWVAEFEAERRRLARALGITAMRIDHHGSTAVPGLAAKPIIDIQVSVERLQPRDAFALPLASLGYRHVASVDDAVCPFFHKPDEWPHTHHVHVVEAGGVNERATLAFRDYLRDHRDVALEYEALKRQLAARSDAAEPSAREAYAQAKSTFISQVVRAALSEGYPQG